MITKSPPAYLFSSFPRLSTTFLQREVRDLGAAWRQVPLFANRRPKQGEFDPQDRDLCEKTVYLYPIRPLRYIRANLKMLWRRPGAFGRALWAAMTLHDGFAWQRSRNLARLAGAAVLAEQFMARGITHLHVHFAFGAAGVALLLKILADIPYSISIHGTDVLAPQPLIRAKLRQASFIVSNCQHHIAYLKAKFPELADQRFYPVPLGLALHRAPWRVDQQIAPLPPLRMVVVARFDPVKNHALLLEALADLQQAGIAFECRLVGDGPTRRQMSALADRLGLSRAVTFLGPLGSSAVAAQIAWSHVVVLSSLSEGTPMTLIEAMAKGRAVVAPDMTGIPELVRHEISGLLYPVGDRAALAACLRGLAADPQRIERYGRAGRRLAEETFDIALHTRRLIDIFQKELNHA